MSRTSISPLSLSELDTAHGGASFFEACSPGAAIGAGIGIAAGAPGGVTIAFGGAIGAVAGCGVGLIAKHFFETTDRR